MTWLWWQQLQALSQAQKIVLPVLLDAVHLIVIAVDITQWAYSMCQSFGLLSPVLWLLPTVSFSLRQLLALP